MYNEQYLTRTVEMDLGHRILHERVKCHSIHGHRVKVELTFQFIRQEAIGYCIDFKEIKRVGCQWLDDAMDHGFIANPHDEVMIKACEATGSKLYLMSLNGEGNYCNPTAENISKEIFMAVEILFESYPDLKLHQVRFYETPNCWVDTFSQSLHADEKQHFLNYRYATIFEYAKQKGMVEYDSRKVQANMVKELL